MQNQKSPSAAERAREDLKNALVKLRTSEGWTAWLKARAAMYTYSLRNQLLIWQQCPEATIVRGRRQWIDSFNRYVPKGSQAIWILAPRTKKVELDDGTEEKKTYFKGVRVYDVSQTAQIPDMPVVPLKAPREPVDGASHEDWIPLLEAHAEKLGFELSYDPELPEGCGGYCSAEERRIVVDENLPANGQVRVLVHELAHAHGISYKDYDHDVAEVMADAICFLVCDQIGLDVSADSVPYIANWSDAAEEVIDAQAKMLDQITRTLASLNDETPAPPNTEVPSEPSPTVQGALKHPVEA
jgi:hypothetical protein